MRCPVHDDINKSASLNLDKGVWWCHAGCGGGSVRQLCDNRDAWVPVANGYRETPFNLEATRVALAEDVPTADDIRFWRKRLMSDPDALAYLRTERGLDPLTIRKAHIGFDGIRFKIPVYGPGLEIWNVRTYDADAPDHRSKIWSVRGMGVPRLYPLRTLRRAERGDAVIICEGEWDTLLALQAGYLAVTRTGAAGVWEQSWNQYFKRLRVYLCHDCDRQGARANRKIGRELAATARFVGICRLPYRMRRKHGKDLTDYCLERRKYGIDAESIRSLLDEATEVI